MIIAFDYPGPFYAADIKIVSSDQKSVAIGTQANTFAQIKPVGEGPWSLFLGTSSVIQDVESADALVLYQGQKSSILHPY